jgi:hypothetical protein
MIVKKMKTINKNRRRNQEELGERMKIQTEAKDMKWVFSTYNLLEEWEKKENKAARMVVKMEAHQEYKCSRISPNKK